jgi:poly(glycerol-phosphate) alpha-glucosyltransferase
VETRVPLPPGRHLALTWGLADHFGGMTSAMLHRSRAFVRLGGVDVDVLTFDTRADYPALERRLRDRGEFVRGMGLINLWDWMREHDVAEREPGGLDLERHPFTPLEPGQGLDTGVRDGVVLSRTRYGSDGATVLQVDHYREDGSLAVSDRCDTRARGELGGRSIVLCDRRGVPVRSWGRGGSLYCWWLDRLQAHSRTFMIVDSKTVARFAAGYQRKKATLVHVVHASHLASGDAPMGDLRESRRAVFEHLDAWHSIVLLTERQRQDVAARGLPTRNLAVIPNGRDLPPAPPMDRAPGRGVVLAGLTARKRVGHAITAVQRVAASVPGLTLDVYGDGGERARLEALAADGDAGGSRGIRFHGYDPLAHERLLDASFIVSTGTSEGFPLVLVEAMAAGCIPIAYDVRYGPADIIAHGRNGFLVPSGDVDALADAIRTLATMTPGRLRRMRRAARRTARRYSDVAVTRRWSTELRAAESRRLASWTSQSVAS